MNKKNVIIPIITLFVGFYGGFYLHKNDQKQEITTNNDAKSAKPLTQSSAVADKDVTPDLPPLPKASVDKYGFPVIPSGPSKKYMEEAQEFLGSCPLSKDENDDCVNNQARFEQEYVNAYSGDYLAQSNIAYELWASPSGILRKNIRQACAWRLIVITSGSPYLSDIDIERSKETCGDIDARDPTVLARAQAIRAVIRSKKVKPVAVPAIDYDPRRDKDETNAGG
ncbi:hypothetical protein [Acetobacter orientalis]|uniref:hypothetical protein n=1 Tax=Acetobacter orientalis TaxID=146474 RepID=UPI00241F456B|nr:hypothetical protein [Acetobacter orientalis]